MSETTSTAGPTTASMAAPAEPGDVGKAAQLAAAELDATIAGIEHRLTEWAADTGAALAAMSGKVTGTAVDKLIRPVVEELVQLPGGYAAGAGFIANAGLLGPERSYIAWWQGPDLEHVDALANFSPNSISRYVKAEWFRIPVETGRAHVTGPYVDFLCTDEYVLTFTHPVFTRPDGPVAGIVGIDVTVQRLERGAMAALRRIGGRATLANADGRAIVSAASDIDAGDLTAPNEPCAQYPVGRTFTLCSDAVGL
ncbi:cache domain-containing protein [Arthrobacter humicola]|uniref:cache domain-containing protein n=1 Tax=Arthrobacter humicola TaxID=409291 RepID=UPI001FAE61AD|nr:cache domain-containing protein [Arthrobacter humicola]MCI9871229.1 PDC sensor domain-containing protein [Arthrobacter humicola]